LGYQPNINPVGYPPVAEVPEELVLSRRGAQCWALVQTLCKLLREGYLPLIRIQTIEPYTDGFKVNRANAAAIV